MSINYSGMVTKQSFEKVKENLKSKGVTNVDFLECKSTIPYNTINPRVDTMNDETVEMVCHLSRNDFWYFLMKVGNVSYNASTNSCHGYELNTGIAAAMYLAVNDCNVYINLPMFSRTVNTMAKYYLWKLLDPEYTFRVLAESEEESQQFVNRICQENNLLPHYLRLSEFSIRNRIKIVRNPKNRIGASNTGRGCTTDICILNLEYIKYIDVILLGLNPLLKTGAVKLMAWSFVGEKGTYGKKTGDQIYSSCNKWIDEMYDIKLDRLKNSVFIVNHHFTDIFEDPERMYDECKEILNNDLDLISRRFAMVR